MPSLVSCLTELSKSRTALTLSLSHCAEFRGQLDMLLSLVVDVTQLVMETAKSHHLLRWKMEREHMEDTHCRTIQDLAMEKVSIYQSWWR